MIRTSVGVVAGGVVWWFGFWALAVLTFASWPQYAAQAKVFMAGGAYAMTLPMSVCDLLYWIVAELCAGWVAVAIARRREAGWVLAVLIMAFLCFEHLYYVWDRLPWWYNLIVALDSGAAVLLGGRLARGFLRPAPAMAAAH
jgi:uncharacterized membrane protein YeaQ/YmgE (transglycosylase-associated protein family)